MTIVYPWPTAYKVRRSRFYLAPHSRGYESPLNRASLYERLAGERWMAELELAPMLDDVARDLAGFLARLDGPVGRVFLSPADGHGYAGARGAGAGDPNDVDVPFGDDATFSDGSTFAEGGDAGFVTTLAARGADSIVINGLLPSVVALERGDLMQIGDPNTGGLCQLLEAAATARSDATGTARVTIRPRLRQAVPALTVVRFYRPGGVFQLMDDKQTAIDRAVITSTHSLRFVEVL